jgi:hypothetical protein
MSVPKGLTAAILAICDNPFASVYWNAGGQAALEGKPITSNIYEPDSYEDIEWRRGWTEIHEDMEE